MKRLYQKIIAKHFSENRQMIFFMGPRQVGKTTTVKLFEKEDDHLNYFNWDNQNDRSIGLSQRLSGSFVKDRSIANNAKDVVGDIREPLRVCKNSC